MKLRVRHFLPLVLSFALSPSAAGGEPDAAAHWQGKLMLPGVELEVAVDLAIDDGEAWTGEIDIPRQGLRNLALTHVTVDGSSVSFRLPGIPGEPTFTGELSADGSVLAGHLQQALQMHEMRLERAGDAEFGVVESDGIEFVAEGRPGEGPVGDWQALLAAGPSRLRLVLHVTSDAEGVLNGALDSVDQGAMNLPVDGLAFAEGKLSFEMARIGARFDGTLSEDGAEIAGEWQQAGAALPLTFKRAGGGPAPRDPD